MTRETVGYDSLYKRALGPAQQLAQFLQAFDPSTADLLRLDSPALDAHAHAANDNVLARALASTMRLPEPEEERQGIYRTAVSAILDALGQGEMGEDAPVALWTLVHTSLPYQLERPDAADVEWTEEDATMVQQPDRLSCCRHNLPQLVKSRPAGTSRTTLGARASSPPEQRGVSRALPVGPCLPIVR